MILQLKNAFFALIIISFFVFANANLSANNSKQQNIHTAAITESMKYNVYTSGEGSFTTTPGTYNHRGL